MLGGNISNQLLNQNGFSNTGTAEQTNLTALCIRCQQVNDLNAGFQNFYGRFLIPEGRSAPVNRPLFLCFYRACLVDRIAQNVKHSAQCCGSNRYLNAGSGRSDLHVLAKSLCRRKTDAANNFISHMLRHFHHALFPVVYNGQCIPDHWQLSFKCNIDDRS